MIKLYSIISYFAKGLLLASILAVNAFGIWHFHPPLEVKKELVQEFAFVSASHHMSDRHSGHHLCLHEHDHEHGHRHRDSDKDIDHECELCWLKTLTKTANFPPVATYKLHVLKKHVVWHFSSFNHRSYLEILSFQVRGPPTWV